MTILITGASGNLGSELSKLYPNALKPTHDELDIRDRGKVFAYIENHRPQIIIHLAALITIRACEENKKLAWETNVGGTQNLINAMETYCPNGKFIYMSTPCVFSGKPEEAPFYEDDIPNPKNFYALTKLCGEIAVSSSKLKWLILRGNFVAKKKWPYPKAFTDRWGTYLFTEDLAKAIKEVIDEDDVGIIHLVGDKKLSMYELAKITTPDIKPMTMKDYSGPPLTQDMSLDTKNWHKYKIGGED